MKVHALRHSYATRLFEAGVPPKTVQPLIGYYDINITMDIYTHVMGDSKLQAVEKNIVYLMQKSIGGHMVVKNNKNARFYFQQSSIFNMFIISVLKLVETNRRNNTHKHIYYISALVTFRGLPFIFFVCNAFNTISPLLFSTST
ncbi:tyrosine-type recombinase/integrase [Metaclostridioides mangenotii]|uniref:tyrosine-type recombinase/integrase n=1 Tax=Metaclostridioides mangenotii TaxID=1540 RepID=UPI0026EC60F7|nr:tyrosine-type recombinase/integrase [Clostridioides mangenotii]